MTIYIALFRVDNQRSSSGNSIPHLRREFAHKSGIWAEGLRRVGGVSSSSRISRVYLEAVIGGCNQANHEVVWRIRPAGSTGPHKDALKCPKETPFRSNPTGLTPLRSRAGVRAANEGGSAG